jgi:hypothetical protein
MDFRADRRRIGRTSGDASLVRLAVEDLFMSWTRRSWEMWNVGLRALGLLHADIGRPDHPGQFLNVMIGAMERFRPVLMTATVGPSA